MKNVLKTGIIAVLVMSLSVFVLAGCGGASDTSSDDTEQTPDTSFLLGSWFAKTASNGETTVDAYDAFQGQFMLYFSDDGVCTMSIGEQRALVDWTYNEDGTVTLTGTDTYPISFPDDSKTKMIMVVKGADVLLEKYEEDEPGESE